MNTKIWMVWCRLLIWNGPRIVSNWFQQNLFGIEDRTFIVKLLGWYGLKSVFTQQSLSVWTWPQKQNNFRATLFTNNWWLCNISGLMCLCDAYLSHRAWTACQCSKLSHFSHWSHLTVVRLRGHQRAPSLEDDVLCRQMKPSVTLSAFILMSPRSLYARGSAGCPSVCPLLAVSCRGEAKDKGSRELQRLRVTFSAQYLQRPGPLL